MKLFLAGIIGMVVGFISLFYFWGAFLVFAKALFTIFIVGVSALALFLGYEEMQANIKAERLASSQDKDGA
ncbi:MAG: hypothetical protein K9K75_03450 [Deltaproteobacteria bacterium]|nr:hypothetical protein [Deltaproteobacteria bacterium]